MSDDQNTTFPISEPQPRGVVLSLHRQPSGTVDQAPETQPGLLADVKVDDRVGLFVKGNYGAGRTRVIDVITQDLEKVTGKKPPYWQIEGGAMFDVNGHCCRPPKDAIMQQHPDDVRLIPWTEVMEAQLNRAEHVRYYKECDWGRLDDKDLFEVVRLLGLDRQAALKVLRDYDFGNCQPDTLEAIATVIRKRTGVDGVL